jgi:hypothetical protein
MPTDQISWKLFDTTRKEERRDAKHWSDEGTNLTNPGTGTGEKSSPCRWWWQRPIFIHHWRFGPNSNM